MLAVDEVDASRFVLKLDLEELAHEVVAVVHDDLLHHGAVGGAELGGVKGEGDHLAGLVRGIGNRHVLEFELAGGKARTLALGNGGELLGEQVELRSGDKVAVRALRHAEAHIATALCLIETKVDHLGRVAIVGTGVVDRKGALLAGLLIKVALAVRNVQLELLHIAVRGGAARTTGVTDGLEGGLGTLAAIDGDVHGHLVRSARAIVVVARVEVGANVAVEQRGDTAAVTVLHRARLGRPRGGGTGGDHTLASGVLGVELSDVDRGVDFVSIPVMGLSRREAKRRGGNGLVQLNRSLASSVELAPRSLSPSVALLILKDVLLDTTGAAPVGSAYARRVFKGRDSLRTVKVDDYRLPALGVFGAPVGGRIAVNRVCGGVPRLVHSRRNLDGRRRGRLPSGFDTRQRLTWLHARTLNELLDIELLGALLRREFRFSKLVVYFGGLEDTVLDGPRTRYRIVSHCDGITGFIGDYATVTRRHCLRRSRKTEHASYCKSGNCRKSALPHPHPPFLTCGPSAQSAPN